MSRGCLCDHCGREAVTNSYTFRRHQGMLVMMQHWHIGGQWCKECANARFWKWTPLTLFVGWLGYASIVVAPVTALINTVQYVHSRSLPGVPTGAHPPELDDATCRRIDASSDALLAALGRKKADLQRIAIQMAPQIGVRPAQIVAFVRAVAAGHSRTSALNTPAGRGFEAMPAVPAVPAVARPGRIGTAAPSIASATHASAEPPALPML